jgi:hypothetical protein
MSILVRGLKIKKYYKKYIEYQGIKVIQGPIVPPDIKKRQFAPKTSKITSCYRFLHVV